MCDPSDAHISVHRGIAIRELPLKKGHGFADYLLYVVVEAAELVEHFQWLTQDQSQTLPPETLTEVGQELADIQIYLIRLADKLGIDMEKAVNAKIELNAKKYPADKVRGKAKYKDCDDGS